MSTFRHLMALSAASLFACSKDTKNRDPAADAAGDTAETSLQVECRDAGVAPGLAPMRRLTKREINRSISDLTGYEDHPATRLPDDASVSGFDNSASRGSVSSLEADGYMRIAEEVALVMVDALEPCSGPSDAACAEVFIKEFGERVYRRPLESAEVDILMEVYEAGGAEETHEDGIELVLATMFQSPQFLYRIEENTDGAVTGYDMASRLSFFLWGSGPDEALLAAAAAGELESTRQIRSQAERLLQDKRARAGQAHFFTQVMGIERNSDVDREDVVWNEDWIDKLQTETEKFVSHVLWDGAGTFDELLTADYSVVDRELATFYGANFSGFGWQVTSLDPNQRSGLLTHASIMGGLAHSNQTSPVVRGKFVRERLLCGTLPDPPDDLDISLPSLDDGMTTRERFARHMQDSACSGCHLLMDPIGFGFEHYDEVGRWRETEGEGNEVDATGFVTSAEGFDGSFYGARELSESLAASDIVKDCMVEQLFRYANGREETEDEACTLYGLQSEFKENDNWLALVLATVESDAFMYREAQ